MSKNQQPAPEKLHQPPFFSLTLLFLSDYLNPLPLSEIYQKISSILSEIEGPLCQV